MVLNPFVIFSTGVIQKAEMPLNDFLEKLNKIFYRTAHSSAQAQDKAFYDENNVEVNSARDLSEDETIIRSANGDHYADSNLHKAQRLHEDLLRIEGEIRESMDQLMEARNDKDTLIKESPFLFVREHTVRNNRILFFFLALVEFSINWVVFADLLGLKITARNIPDISLCITVFGMSFVAFISLVVLSEKFIKSQTIIQRCMWALSILCASLILSLIRNSFVNGLQGSGMYSPSWFSPEQILLLLCIPAVSIFAALAKEKYTIALNDINVFKSKSLQINRLIEVFQNRLNNLKNEREMLIEKLQVLIEEYRIGYQNAQRERRENARRRIAMQIKEQNIQKLQQGKLTEYELWYTWWARRRQRKQERSIRPVRALMPIAVTMLCALFLFSGCTNNSRNRFNLVVVGDRSSSANEYSCTKDIIQNLALAWLEKADESDGGMLRIYLVGTNFDDTPLFFSAEYPDHFQGPILEHKNAWKKEFVNRLSGILSSLPINRGSAIAEAIARASITNPEPGHTMFVVASDLREVNSTFNFEKRVPTFEAFSRWIDEKSIHPHFDSTVSVCVIGVHPNSPANTSKMTAKNYDSLVDIWEKIFHKWGTTAKITETTDNY